MKKRSLWAFVGVESRGFDPRTSHMLSECSTKLSYDPLLATPPYPSGHAPTSEANWQFFPFKLTSVLLAGYSALHTLYSITSGIGRL